MKKLLIAGAPESAALTAHALSGCFDLAVANSMAQARQALSENIDVILCGLHFDEGKMFDFLREVKSAPGTRSIPFLCIKSTDGVLSPAIVQSIEIASRTMGADGFVELFEWNMKFGEGQAHEKLRRLIDELR
jgi:CheY-like chemotaxis protein